MVANHQLASTGQKTKLLGALLPDAYELRPDPQFPFVCPVTSCRALFSTLQGVDLHFYVSLYSSLLYLMPGAGTYSPIEVSPETALQRQPEWYFVHCRSPYGRGKPPRCSGVTGAVRLRRCCDEGAITTDWLRLTTSLKDDHLKFL